MTSEMAVGAGCGLCRTSNVLHHQGPVLLSYGEFGTRCLSLVDDRPAARRAGAAGKMAKQQPRCTPLRSGGVTIAEIQDRGWMAGPGSYSMRL